MRKMALILALIFATGCAVTTHVTVPNQEVKLDFKKYKKIKVAIQDNVNTTFSISGMPVLEGLLQGRLKSIGYSVVNEDEDLGIDIQVVIFKPDNKALRMLVGFGSGKGALVYRANFKDHSGLIATLDGGKSYGDVTAMLPFGDMETTVFRGEETTKMLMIQHSVDQIIDFIRADGERQKVKEE